MTPVPDADPGNPWGMEDSDSLRSRSAREALDDHLKLRAEGDLDGDLERNYHEDVVILTPNGVYHGRDGVREAADLLYEAIEDPSAYEYSSVVCDDRMAMLEWAADCGEMKITDGVDSYLIEDGRICAQTIRYTVTFGSLSQAHSLG